MNVISARTAQRYDALSNWQEADPVLLNGEIAIISSGNYIKFKVGNGISSFTQLPYSDTNLSVNSLAIGWQNVAGQQSIAVGYDVSATGQRAAAFGYTANASDNGAFVFNGDNSYPVISAYQSHGVGTFNVNAPLSDIYVQQSAFSDILSSKAEISSLQYALVNAVLSSCTYNNTQCVSCQIEDRTITTISVDGNTPDVVVFLPQKQSATAARDFILRVEISAATVPGFTFVGAGNESVQYDSEDDEWYVLEPGLNLISFTETK